MRAVNNFHRESADDYRGELHRAERWRVIICRDQIQFIIQRCKSRAQSGAGARWVGRHYCTTRDATIRLWQRDVGQRGEVLKRLPDRAPLLDLDRWTKAGQAAEVGHLPIHECLIEYADQF